MKRKYFLLSVIVLCTLLSKAQFTENFDDDNFTANPTWIGDVSDWLIDAGPGLQSNNMVPGSAYYLSTASTLATVAQWEMDIRLTFNTSSTNYVDVFLTASSSDLTAAATTGYFVRIGNTEDEISLYRKAAGGTVTKLIDGVNGITNTSNNILRLKITRDAGNQWVLQRDISGSGNSYVVEGMVTDNVFNTSSFFGILVKQSTASFFQRHFFDNIEVKAFVPDTAPPEIVSVTVQSENTVDVLFNEAVTAGSSAEVTNYSADNGVGTLLSAVQDAANPALVRLTFAGRFPGATAINLTVKQVLDLAGNAMINASKAFTYFPPYTPVPYDIVIDEIMSDPTPLVGLPDNEWVELKNTSNSAINLQGWKIGNAGGSSGTMPSFVLLPDSFVIVCGSSSVAAMQAYGRVISVASFPSLDNTSGRLFLLSDRGSIIHSVSYHVSWYQNELKKAGGWTLEMIDTNNPCTGAGNWKASTDLSGGTPGRKNSADAVNPDTGSPKLVKAYTPDPHQVVLVFDEPLDSAGAIAAGNYTISDGIGTPVKIRLQEPRFDRVILDITTPLAANKVYTVTASGLADCAGNAIGTKNTVRVGISEVADSLDIVINEILFNPAVTGTDYVEIYNRGSKVIDLKQVYLANRNSSGIPAGMVPLTDESHLFFPGDFLVVTESIALVKAAYIAQNPEAFLEIASMPSYNDDQSTVLLLNAQGNIIDQVTYSDKWHFKLIDNKEGVSLERIDYHAPTQSADNWHSAATSAGYGTPTYKNSQYRVNDGLQGEVKLTPEIVSPDNDGQDDFANIDYHFPEPGYVASITIFDGQGRVVRYLRRNALCGVQGNFRWDGLGENSQRLATGVYVVFTEVFNLKGQRKQFKNAIVLARRY